MGDIGRQLTAHVERQQGTITEVLGRFFDPKDGHVNQRLTAFLNDDGVLARVLDKYLGPANSVLAETLARQVGESSPLLKKLSPTDSEGIIKTLETQLRTVMENGHAQVLKALGDVRLELLHPRAAERVTGVGVNHSRDQPLGDARLHGEPLAHGVRSIRSSVGWCVKPTKPARMC